MKKKLSKENRVFNLQFLQVDLIFGLGSFIAKIGDTTFKINFDICCYT